MLYTDNAPRTIKHGGSNTWDKNINSHVLKKAGLPKQASAGKKYKDDNV